MLQSVIKFLKGYLIIQIIGDSPERFINMCSFHKIYLWNIVPAEHGYKMNIWADDFTKIKPYIRKAKIKIRIQKKIGFRFLLFHYRKRRVFTFGVFACIVAVFLCSRLIWQIEIIGNHKISDDTLVRFLQERKIHCGMLTKQVDCSRIVTDIRKAYDDIVWVSASINGTRLIVRVKENETDDLTSIENPGKIEKESGMDLIANEDGTIEKMITRTGIPLVKEGDIVKKGEILVSGAIPIRNDSNEVIGYTYEIADADIILLKQCNYYDECSLYKEEKEFNKIYRKYRLSVRIGERLITLGDKKKYIQYCYQITNYPVLFQTSSQPLLTFCQTHVQYYKTTRHKKSEETIQNELSKNYQQFCEEQQKKGVEIIRNDVKIYNEKKRACAKGSVTLRCSVGERKPTKGMEEIVDGNDRNNN